MSEQIIDQILKHPLFLYLKNIVENDQGWHDHEDVYSHSLKTAEIARRELEADFISNSQAKKLFLDFMAEETAGTKRGAIIHLIALIHDCGKLLNYREGGNIHRIQTPKPEEGDNQATCPGHEYYGGALVVKELLTDLSLADEVKDYIAQVVKLHGTFNQPQYFASKANWTLEQIISDIKARAEGYYFEALFIAYCDGYTAPAFMQAREKIKKIFNAPNLYLKRTYLIPTSDVLTKLGK